MTDMHESGEEYDRQRRAVIFDELPHMALEESTSTNNTTCIADHQDQEGYHNCKISRCIPGRTPLAGQHLDAFLQIDKGHVEAENVTGESSDVGQGVAGIGDGKDPVHH